MAQPIGERFARALADKDAPALEANRPAGEFTVEQQAHYETDGDRISSLQIMRTGFLPASET